LRRDLLPHMSREKYWEPIKWTARHSFMVALEMAGLTPSQIAAKLGCNMARVSVILNDPRAEHERSKHARRIADNVTEVSMSLKLHAREALSELVEELRECEDVRIRQKSAIAILDRAGYSKYQGEHVPQQQLGAEAADRIEKAVGQIKAASPDVDYQEADFEVLPDE
jgi:transposase